MRTSRITQSKFFPQRDPGVLKCTLPHTMRSKLICLRQAPLPRCQPVRGLARPGLSSQGPRIPPSAPRREHLIGLSQCRINHTFMDHFPICSPKSRHVNRYQLQGAMCASGTRLPTRGRAGHW